MKITLRATLCLLLAAVLALAPVPRAALAEKETHVVILGTSDMHGNTLGYAYEDNAFSTNNGMARLYTYIKKGREENPIVFLVDAGDEIQGTIMTDDIANKFPDQEHPVVAAMNYMGYATTWRIMILSGNWRRPTAPPAYTWKNVNTAEAFRNSETEG